MGPVLRLPANTEGRDFVIGDIHGAYDSVLDGMRSVKFNPAVDRLFSLGDLVDRGNGSDRCLEFLAQPYVHALRGNHDDDLCTLSVFDARVLASINFNGMGWITEVSDERLQAIQRRLSELPIVIEVETPRGLVGMLHGDVPKGMAWDEFVTFIELGHEEVTQTALVGRYRIDHKDDSGVPGIGRVFVGHTVTWDGPQRLGNVIAMDTGAIFGELAREREIRQTASGEIPLVTHEPRGALAIANIVASTTSFAMVRPNERAIFTIDGPVGRSPFKAVERPRIR